MTTQEIIQNAITKAAKAKSEATRVRKLIADGRNSQVIITRGDSRTSCLDTIKTK